jgi:hypothetical protein
VAPVSNLNLKRTDFEGSDDDEEITIG